MSGMRRLWHSAVPKFLLVIIAVVASVQHLGATVGAQQLASQCPWPRNYTALNAGCLCNSHPAGNQELSIQCNLVDFEVLMTALSLNVGRLRPINLLYVNDSSISQLGPAAFSGVRVHNVQLSFCRISRIANDAFVGQEETLVNLNLQGNALEDPPVEALRTLRRLSLLDLSRNKISFMPDNSFVTLKLQTLKLADNNNLTFGDRAFRGLERVLKNLNLKGTNLGQIPRAIRNLTALAFLDLAQNGLSDFSSEPLANLHSLTALNLERNFIRSLKPGAFSELEDTLSSLSLLNNLLSTYPLEALKPLSELRVLDIGFNKIQDIPEDAFESMQALTLLALDGNPLQTLPMRAFSRLNSTLRGLSLGSQALVCDCSLRWIAEWIRDLDLQVTSRERNPQFCGNPPNLRERTFYQISPQELICPEPELLPAATTVSSLSPSTGRTSRPSLDERLQVFLEQRRRPQQFNRGNQPQQQGQEQNSRRRPPPTTRTEVEESVASNSDSGFRRQQFDQGSPEGSRRRTTTPFPRPPITTTATQPFTTTITTTARTTTSTTARTTPFLTTGTVRIPTLAAGIPVINTTPKTTLKQLLPTITVFDKVKPSTYKPPIENKPKPRPKIVTKPTSGLGDESRSNTPLRATGSKDQQVLVTDAFREDSSVIIQWESLVGNLLGFRVVYRLFGDTSFKQGPPLASSEREFRIKNVPGQECIIVCVVSLEHTDLNPESVPLGQCREIRTEAQGHSSHMDRIIIAASSAICVTVILAVIVFICCSRCKDETSAMRMRDKSGMLPPVIVGGFGGSGKEGLMGGPGIPTAGAPLASLGSLGSLASLHPVAAASVKDWDAVSMYSARSIPRARMYHHDRAESVVGGYIPEDARSHVSHMSHATTDHHTRQHHGSQQHLHRQHHHQKRARASSRSMMTSASGADGREYGYGNNGEYSSASNKYLLAGSSSNLSRAGGTADLVCPNHHNHGRPQQGGATARSRHSSEKQNPSRGPRDRGPSSRDRRRSVSSGGRGQHQHGNNDPNHHRHHNHQHPQQHHGSTKQGTRSRSCHRMASTAGSNSNNSATALLPSNSPDDDDEDDDDDVDDRDDDSFAMAASGDGDGDEAGAGHGGDVINWTDHDLDIFMAGNPTHSRLQHSLRSRGSQHRHQHQHQHHQHQHQRHRRRNGGVSRAASPTGDSDFDL